MTTPKEIADAIAALSQEDTWALKELLADRLFTCCFDKKSPKERVCWGCYDSRAYD